MDGYVQAIVEVGNLVIVGGNFSTVRNPTQTQQLHAQPSVCVHAWHGCDQHHVRAAVER